MATKHIPNGYHTATPYLILKDAARGLEFYKSVFDAKEIMRMPTPSGRIAHAEIRIGDSHIMLADEVPAMGYHAPQSLGGTPVFLMIYVDDVDAVFAHAVAAGALIERPVQNQFYGDRSGTVKDPFGHVWTIATHIEDVSPEEMSRRSQDYMKRCAQQEAHAAA
jgi:PhnB protein